MNKGLTGICLLLLTLPLCAQERMPDHLRQASPQLVRPVSRAGMPVAKRVSASDLSAQHNFLRSMPSAWVEYAPSGATRQIRGSLGLSLPKGGADFREGDSAPGLLSLVRPALLARGMETLTVTKNKVVGYNKIIGANERVIRLEQSIRGIPVRSSAVVFSVNDQTGAIASVSANFLPDRGLPQKPVITASQAIVAVMKELAANDIKAPAMSPEPPTLAYVLGASIDEPDRLGRLVWCVEFDDGHEINEGLVDAIDGRVITIRQVSSSALSRTVYSDNNQDHAGSSNLPTPLTLLFNEGGSHSDPIAQNAYANAANVHQAYMSLVQRDSTQANGNTLNLVVHWGQPSPNARYVRSGGQDYFFFHDGSGSRQPFGNNLDIVAHEFGHGVTRKEVGFDQFPSDGAQALDEAYGDFSAVLVDVANRGDTTAPATWVIAEGTYTAAPSSGLRYWDNPARDNPWAKDWFPTRSLQTSVEGGQYLNSTIMGHAFYLLANGGTHVRAGTEEVPTIQVPALNIQKTRDIFFRALLGPDLLPISGFSELRQATINAANQVYGSTDAQAVEKAWDAVGVCPPCANAPSHTELSVENFCPFWKVQIPTVGGAVIYNLQSSRTPSFAIASTVSDNQSQGCDIEVYQWVYLRARSCNCCGCSPWSTIQIATPFVGECP
jgi:Zn-dependent metalloprotease